MVDITYQEGVAEDIKEMTIKVMEEFNKEFPDVDLDDIYFLRSSSKKPRKYFARIICSSQLFHHFTRLPLVIEVNSDAFDSLDDKMKRVVLYHELCHIAINKKGNYVLRCHDIQEFSRVLETFGGSVSINLHNSYEEYNKKTREKLKAEKEAEKESRKKKVGENSEENSDEKCNIIQA